MSRATPIRRAPSSLQLVSHENDQLPTLAWCVVMRRGADVVELHHGLGVETAEDWFYEGAFAGQWGEPGFVDNPVSFGSGGSLRRDRLTICTPSHSVERLFSVATSDKTRLVFSNSLPFALAMAGAQLRLDYREYIPALLSVILGIDKDQALLPADGGVLRQHIFCNIEVDRSLHIAVKPREPGILPTNFREFESMVWNGVRGAIENAAAPQRRSQYRPLTTVSSGYDSTACAALAKRAGCSQSVTFEDSVRGTNDSGSEVAASLGLDVSVHRRLDYRSRADIPDDEYLVLGTIEDIVMSSLEDRLRGVVFLTGFHGDKVWAKTTPFVSNRLARGDASGNTLAEMRLRVGFIHLIPPMIGAVFAPELQRISRSSEMEQWSVGGRYDRPLPRRIAEEAGVPRDAFGREKAAIVQPYEYFIEDLASTMTPNAYFEYHTFADANPLPATAKWRHRIAERFQNGSYIGKRAMQKYGGPHGRRVIVQKSVELRSAFALSESALTVQWAATRLVRRYKACLGEWRPHRLSPEHS